MKRHGTAFPRPLRKVAAAVTATTAAAAMTLTLAPSAAAATYQYDCRRLAGVGTYSSPLALGNVTGRTVVAVNCPPLTSGAGYANRYFSFTLTRSARVRSYAGASFVLNRTQKSAVNPSLARGPYAIMHTSAGLWTYDRGGVFNGRYLPLAPLPGGGVLPAGTYRLNTQKLDSPLRSLSTPGFNVVVAAP
ncbi:hypothetical protein [Streptomyces sp. NBC_00199]|jgi:hypothetical protein|uniref:hypothetical protein n=1 Tax=Streptomyces sp. NBC_00199 TaxID=2975678 RepID=UPI002251751A|nr:hypothetical protein [Streptomyces sp. NBC_00199]MCX5265683.1 hypothetical protein [Streptomyces sp. NBC_00199]